MVRKRAQMPPALPSTAPCIVEPMDLKSGHRHPMRRLLRKPPSGQVA